MTGTRRGSPADAARSEGPDGLAILGLRPGETVRWRSGAASRWRTGRVTHRERDGSVAVTDARGLARSLSVEILEVHCAGPRGGAGWEALVTRASRTEQLRLL
ncbi:MAG TPA: hypothetical protein VFN68_11760 [Acidimicrobiales bacterium]|nr:hypothetical protein [Acidimicrobiales bacterium]